MTSKGFEAKLTLICLLKKVSIAIDYLSVVVLV